MSLKMKFGGMHLNNKHESEKWSSVGCILWVQKSIFGATEHGSENQYDEHH